jgi:cation diffusion facilitator family transporter
MGRAFLKAAGCTCGTAIRFTGFFIQKYPKRGLNMFSPLIRLFIKDYENTSAPQVRKRYGRFAGIMGIASNLLLFLIKIITGLACNSISIVADAVNNLTDSGTSLITLVCFKISGKPADAQHPYGHERMEYIAGQIVAFITLVLGFELMRSSIEKIIRPQAPEYSLIAMALLAFSILVKLWQCLFFRRISKIIDSISLLSSAADSRNDILATSSVLLAAVISSLTGFNLDGYMGALVALFIMISGIKLLREITSTLLGTAPTKELVDLICSKVLSYDNIIGIHDLSVHSYGPTQCFASLHCEVPAELDAMLGHDIIDNIERDFLNDLGIHLVIHLDPVVTSDEKTNALKEKVEKLIARLSPEIGMHDFRVVWSVSHTNLIFDITVPFDFKWSNEELTDIISKEISSIDSSYNPVITVDRGSTSVERKK